MKIQRVIDNVPFNIELFPCELSEAYYEYQRKLDIEEVISFAEVFSNEELKDYYDCEYSDIVQNKEQIASTMRKHIDGDMMTMSEARELAVREVIMLKTAVS